MAINLNKHRDAMLAAWSDVLNNKTPTNWALFGYEGLSNDLKFISKGSQGIEEMTEDLNSGKIMYAFLQVIDPKTSLPKNVLINWQGEGAPNVRKGTCANHVRDVSNLFKGAHVTLNARTEEEVDPELIIDKVSKSTGSVYKFNERADNTNDSGPVGTTYKRTIPKQEINAQERDRFWEQQEEEEKQRQEFERRRREEDKRKLEEERQRRDCAETAQREAKIMEAAKTINQIRLAEQASYDRSQVEVTSPVEDLEKEELERRNRAEILRRQRSEEAQALIAKRTIDARAVFEQNTATGQLVNRRSSVQNKIFRETETIDAQKSNAAPVSQKENAVKKAEQEMVKSEPVAALPKESVTNGGSNGTHTFPKSINGSSTNVVEEESQDWEDDSKHEIPMTISSTQSISAIEETLLLPPEQFFNGDVGLSARALYDYQAADDTEITFDPGDVITHIDQIDEGWWQGLGPDGTFGLFPANYVELIH